MTDDSPPEAPTPDDAVDEEILAALASHDGLAGTGDVAATVDVDRTVAAKRLEELEREGYVDGRELDGAMAWSPAESIDG